jgi:hypothetical protein
MKPTFDRQRFLSAATELLEDIVPSGTLGLGDVPIRELTAAQNLEAIEVAKLLDGEGNEITLPDGTAKIDNALYWAALVQMSVLDPATCYDGETFVPGKGTLLLSPEDIPALAGQGKEGLQRLVTHIRNLSWLTQDHLFRSRTQAHDRQSPTGAGAPTAGAGTPGEGAGDGGDGAAVGAGDVPDVARPAKRRKS